MMIYTNETFLAAWSIVPLGRTIPYLMYSYMNFARNANSTVAVQFSCYAAMQSSLHKRVCISFVEVVTNTFKTNIDFFNAIPFLDQSQGLCVILGKLWIM